MKMYLVKTLFSFLALALFSALATAGVKIEHWTTATGARVYFVEARGVPILDVQIDFSAGNVYTAPGKAGLPGLTRSLLDAGAGDLDEEKLAERLTDTGAQLGGGVDNDRASVALRTLSAKPERDAALALMRTVLSAPTFRKPC